MARYFLTGGRQRVSTLFRREEWTSFDRAVLATLDDQTGKVEVVFQYEGPPERVPAVDPSHLFKSASWDGDRLLLCTQTEVLVFDPARGVVERTISHPCFNDVHHVARVNGRIHVVSTGLDAVVVLDDEGEVASVQSVTGTPTWSRFDPAVDYRRVATTKPHQAHPNFVQEAHGRTWVTRFEQRDAWPVDGGESVLLADRPVHDGVLAEGRCWFTAVSGEVVVTDPVTSSVVSRHNLDSIPREGNAPLGWCRGLLVEPERVLVGFSRLRPTKFVQNLAWLRAPLDRPEPLPSRVSAYDRGFSREVARWSVEEAGMSAVFSVLPGEGERQSSPL